MTSDDAASGGEAQEERSLEALRTRLAFLCLEEEDATRLRQLIRLLESKTEDFVDGFYEHLFRFEETARFLNDSDRVERLKQLQRHHMNSLLEARWDEAYARQRRRVGQAHAEVGLEPQLFLGGYNQYLQFCLARISDGASEAETQRIQMIGSLIKAILFDVGLSLDAYFMESTRNLRQALEMYWKTNTELRQFAQLTSHDMKTPLATVANLCDEALDEFGDEMPEGARQLIEKGKAGIFRMSTLIDELLSTTLVPVSTESDELVATGEVIEEVLERICPLIEDKQIQVSVPRELPNVKGNKVRLREAFYNLLLNAAKYVDASPARIKIHVVEQEQYCEFTFADNGPGIPPEERERIFSPFHRMPAHRHQTGSGLGLYFTKSLIEEQQGRVWVESEVGVGSQFHVRLRRGDPGDFHEHGETVDRDERKTP